MKYFVLALLLSVGIFSCTDDDMELQPVPCVWIGGQSGAMGKGDPNLLPDTMHRVNGMYIYANWISTIEPYVVGLNSNGHSGPGVPPKIPQFKFGMEYSLGKRLLQDYNELYILKTPIGGSSLHLGWRNTGNAWLLTEELYGEFVELLAEQGKQPNWIMAVWDQGESDMGHEIRAINYYPNLYSLEERVYELLQLNYNIPWISVRPYDLSTAPWNRQYSDIVRTAITEFSIDQENHLMCTSDSWETDDSLHRNTHGVLDQGICVYDTYDYWSKF